jgi:hypothetical protein
VFVPWISVDGMLDTAFKQICNYAANDVVVGLRSPRAIALPATGIATGPHRLHQS